MKNTLLKRALVSLVLISLILSCTKTEETPEPNPSTVDHSMDSVELLVSGKGFNKVYGYIEPIGAPYYPGTLNEIHGLDLTVYGTDPVVHFAYKVSGGSQQGVVEGVMRGSAYFSTNTILWGPEAFTYTQPSGSSWQPLGFSFAPFSNTLCFMYYDYSGPGYVSGDLNESSGQSLLTSDRRIAKTGHSVYSITGAMGAGSATPTNGFSYAYYDANGQFNQLSSSDGTWTGIQFQLRPSSLYRGVFEPILSTNEGIVVLYSNDSINLYLNNLATPAVKFTAIGKVSLTVPMSLSGTSIIKNNATNDNFSFACVEGTTAWTFKYDNQTKTVTKVFDGATLPANVTSMDIDENGNLYYVVGNSVFTQNFTTGAATVAENVLNSGTVSLLKYYNGKIFLLAERFVNSDGTQGRRQLDILIQQ